MYALICTWTSFCTWIEILATPNVIIMVRGEFFDPIAQSR